MNSVLCWFVCYRNPTIGRAGLGANRQRWVLAIILTGTCFVATMAYSFMAVKCHYWSSHFFLAQDIASSRRSGRGQLVSIDILKKRLFICICLVVS